MWGIVDSIRAKKCHGEVLVGEHVVSSHLSIKVNNITHVHMMDLVDIYGAPLPVTTTKMDSGEDAELDVTWHVFR